jgi:hypothetical protein
MLGDAVEAAGWGRRRIARRRRHGGRGRTGVVVVAPDHACGCSEPINTPIAETMAATAVTIPGAVLRKALLVIVSHGRPASP